MPRITVKFLSRTLYMPKYGKHLVVLSTVVVILAPIQMILTYFSRYCSVHFCDHGEWSLYCQKFFITKHTTMDLFWKINHDHNDINLTLLSSCHLLLNACSTQRIKTMTITKQIVQINGYAWLDVAESSFSR